MNADLAIVLVLLAAAIAMFAINKPRMDAVALIMLTVLPFTGVITMGEALAGFSDPNIVLLGGAVRDRRGPGAHGRGPAARRLAHRRRRAAARPACSSC